MNQSNRPTTGFFDETPIFEFTAPSTGPLGPPQTADDILFWMRSRSRRGFTPLPHGFVPPPGIDIAELLKQLPERYRPKPD